MTPAVATPESTRVGWIGAGVMGVAMCAHVIEAGYATSITTRTRRSARSLEDMGAVWCQDPSEVAARSQVIFVMVGSPSDVRTVIEGDTGVLAGAAAESIVIDMTTSSPSLARELFQLGTEQRVQFIDAPVTGGDIGARSGTLSIMAGGMKEPITYVLPLLECLGKKVVVHGSAGAGQHAKMVNQILVAGTVLGLVEGMRYAEGAGLDVPAVLESMAAGSAGSWILANYAPRIQQRDYDPGFAIAHFVKDLKIVLDESQALGIEPLVSQRALELYERCEQHGRGALGIQGLYEEVLEGQASAH